MTEPTELQRRRTLAGMTKTELIEFIIGFQDAVSPLIEAIERAYGNEP